MRIKEIKVYKFDELSEDAQEKALSQFREDYARDSFIAETTIEMEAEDMGKKPTGITFDNLYFDLSRGANCRGEEGLDYDLKIIFERLKEQIPGIEKRFARYFCPCTFEEIGLSWGFGRGIYEGCFSLDLSPCYYPTGDRHSEFEEILRVYFIKRLDGVIESIEKELEYQSSNEVLSEYLRDLEYEFTEEGELT